MSKEEYIEKGINRQWTDWKFEAENYKKMFEQLQQENKYLKLSCPEQNIEHFRIVREHKRKIDNLRKQNKELKEEVKELRIIVGLRQKRNLIRKFDEEYDKEDKLKNPNRDYAGIMPDAEEVYRRYYKQKEVIEEVREYIKDSYVQVLKYYDEPSETGSYELVTIDVLQILDKEIL